MEREGSLFDEDTKTALGQVTTDLEKVQYIFREIKYNTEPMSAKIPQYIETKILTVEGIFTKHQINRESVPKGLNAYDVQYSRDEMKPELLWPKVIGHRFGTVIAAGASVSSTNHDIDTPNASASTFSSIPVFTKRKHSVPIC